MLAGSLCSLQPDAASNSADASLTKENSSIEVIAQPEKNTKGVPKVEGIESSNLNLDMVNGFDADFKITSSVKFCTL